MELLECTPSRMDGISKETELSLRSKSCWMIEEVGMRVAKTARSAPSSQVKNERPIISTACVLFHRFYSVQSFSVHDRHVVGIACLFLAGKIEESPRKLKDIIMSFFSVRFKRNPEELECKEWHDKVIIAERILLHTLGFELLLHHPYGHCISVIREFKRHIPEDRMKDVRQFAYNFINDSFRSTLCLQYSHQEIAVAAVFLALLTLELTPVLPMKRGLQSDTHEQTWLDLVLVSISEAALRDICHQIVEVYELKHIHEPASLNLTTMRQSMGVVFSESPEAVHEFGKAARTRSRTLSHGEEDVVGAAKRKRSMTHDEIVSSPNPAESSSYVTSSAPEVNGVVSGAV